ncbi:MAG: hypothetical protein IJ721_00640 [Bacteroidales bacterium]|nr:hypothetical protein [Bacteroidales bacterium]
MKKRTTFLLLLPFIAMACSDSYLDGILSRVESLMAERPDSALILLQKSHVPDIDTPGRQARYSLDLAMALDKNWIDTTAVEIIQPALRFYRGPFRKREQFLSRYYYARILENGQHHPEAIKAFMEAAHLFNHQVDSVYLLRIAAAKGRIYWYELIRDKTEESFVEAIRYAVRLHDTANYQRMSLSLADFYEGDQQYAKKDSLLPLIGPVEPDLKGWKAKSVADLVFRHPEDSLRYPDDWAFYCEAVRHDPESVDWTSRARYYLFRHRPAEAIAFLDTVPAATLPPQRLTSLWLLRMWAHEMLGDYKRAYEDHVQYTSRMEALSLQIFQNDIRLVEDRYQHLLAGYKDRAVIIALSCLAALLVVALGWLVRRKRQKEALLSGLREEYDLLVQVRNSELARNEVFSRKLESRLTALKPYIANDFPEELSDSSELRRMTEDSKQMLRTIGFLFGMYHPRFILTLEEKGLSELETGYCCLFALGFAGKEIPSKLHRNTFYNASSAIRKKVGLGPHDTNLSLWVQDLYKKYGNNTV